MSQAFCKGKLVWLMILALRRMIDYRTVLVQYTHNQGALHIIYKHL